MVVRELNNFKRGCKPSFFIEKCFDLDATLLYNENRSDFMNLKMLKDKSFQILVCAIVCAVFGVLFCVLTQKMLNFLQTAICVVTLIYGAFNLISFCVVASEDRQTATFFHGVVPFAIGLLLIFVPAFFVNAVGAIIVLFAVLKLVRALKIKNAGWIKNFIVAIFFILAGAGLIVLCNLKIDQTIVMIYLGVTLILEASMLFVDLYLGKKNQPKVAKEQEVNQSNETEVAEQQETEMVEEKQ